MMDKDFEFVFDDDEDTKKNDEASGDGDGGEPTIPLSAVKEVIAEAVKEAVQAVAPARQSEPVVDETDAEIARLRQELEQVNEAIKNKLASGVDTSDPELGQLFEKRLKIENRLGVLEVVAPIKRENQQLKQYSQLAVQAPARIDQLVRMHEADLARFGNKRREVEDELRASLAQVGSQRPDILFDDAQVVPLIRAFLGDKMLKLLPDVIPHFSQGVPGQAGTNVKIPPEIERVARKYDIDPKSLLEAE